MAQAGPEILGYNGGRRVPGCVEGIVLKKGGEVDRRGGSAQRVAG
jgi:hypothetical protein